MSDYNNLSETELQVVIEKAEIALKEKQSKKKKQVIAEIKSLAASIGVTVDIKGGAEKTVRKGKKVDPKYRNPDDASKTWTGRGVAPKWMQALLSAGKDKSEFLI